MSLKVLFQCILNVSLSNDWCKVTHSQVHASPILKNFPFFMFIKFWQNPKCRRPRIIYIY